MVSPWGCGSAWAPLLLNCSRTPIYRRFSMSQRSRTNETTIPSCTRQAVVYARVSSKEQEKEGFSIAAQLKLLRDYARWHLETTAQRTAICGSFCG